MSVLKCDMREKAFRICRDYLNGAWKHINSHELVLKQISGGLSNFLYYCALPTSLQPKSGEPSRVLVRFYGQVHGEGAFEALVTESVIFTLLSERRLGPKLYGVFPGGRLEEFIPARPLKTKELADPGTSALIAGKMAQIHCLDVPISKEPTWLWNTLERWMNNMKTTLPSCKVDEKHRKLVDTVLDWDLEKEMVWLRTFLEKTGSPVVFSHNDLQEGNILVREKAKTEEERLVIIDFEYCSYNYRGFDLANHFCEWMYDYTVKVYPNFSYTPAAMPSVDQQLFFIRCYMDMIQKERGMKSQSQVVALSRNEFEILRETQCFMLASHFFWGLWSVVNAPEYAVARLGAYYEHKKLLAEMELLE